MRKNFNIYFEGYGKYSFDYYYNSNSNYYDLLENLAYIFSSRLDICLCNPIQISNDLYFTTYSDVDKKELIKNCESKNLKIMLAKECKCNYKNYLKKSKKDIIDDINNYIRENEDLKIEIKKLKKDLDTYKDNLIKKIQEKKDLENKIFDIVSKIEKRMGDKNNLVNKEINKLKEEIQNQNEQKRINSQKIMELTAKNEELMEEKNRSEKSNKETNFIDFYDVIVDIKSIKDICNGWQIKMNENAKANYENFKKDKVLKIGVIGNSNKGKSFLLSKISQILLPSGTSIRTEGLSIKYPDLTEYQNRKIVLLDSAVLETPVLIDEQKINNENTVQTINKANNNENTIQPIIDTTNKEMEKTFREKSREKLITELFLQNYIIINSDIIIIVVGILTYSEQKLLSKIKNQIFNLKNRTKVKNKTKSLIIIHNLITYKTRNQVEEYINDFLLKSATFVLEGGHNISTKKGGKGIDYYFYEKLDEQQIFHLIFAHDGSEAGNYYNNSTLQFIENCYQTITNLTNYDVIETLKECFIDLSKDILEKTDKPLTKESFEKVEDKIKLSVENNITLKKCLIDELGLSSLRANGFEPTYNYYKKDNTIILKIEVPGNFTLKSSILSKGEYNYIQIKGNKKKDKEPKEDKDNIDNKREYGDFNFNIGLEASKYPIKKKDPKQYDKKGVIFLEYELDEEVKESEFGTKEEEEI